jgi:alkyl hydroperoxide reductase subunit F
MYEVAVLGGGPAGLAATMYCLRKGLDVQLVPGQLGGKAAWTFTVENLDEHHVIRPREQVTAYRGHIEYLTHLWRPGTVKNVVEIPEMPEKRSHFEITLSTGDSFTAERLIVATGVKTPRLGVPGEREFMGKGVGTSAISYTHLLRDRRVVIIGNSDRALEAAMEAAQQAAAVELILEPQSTHQESHANILETREHITVHRRKEVKQFSGDAFARELTLAGGLRVTGDAFFLEHEPVPNSRVVAHLVQCTATGAIKIDARNRTSHQRIFAAGDVTTVGMEQIMVALGEGARAALSAYQDFITAPHREG